MKNRLLLRIIAHTFLLAFLNLPLTLSSSIAMMPSVEEEDDSAETLASPPMRFKVGFELQEGSSLCPWALENFHVQKKELFSLSAEEKTQKLWHVVLDGSDIEFVTVPFSPTERPLIEECTKTIVASIHILKEMPEQEVAFMTWVEALRRLYRDRVSDPSMTLREHIRETQIQKPSEWTPVFAPQVTIQHPLEYSIYLYFGLFGFKNPASMMPFTSSLPLRNLFIEYHGAANSEEVEGLFHKYFTPMSGLAFLHALTLTQMTPVEDADDAEFLKETWQCWENYRQVDAKMKLSLMSRRPFSMMLKDVAARLELEQSTSLSASAQSSSSAPQTFLERYSPFFRHIMLNNLSFKTTVPLFAKANYAEQFFDKSTGQVRPLLYLLDRFEDDFVEIHEQVLTDLLKNGIISTAMLRHLKPQYDQGKVVPLLKNGDGENEYWSRILESVAFPRERYKLDVEESASFLIRAEASTADGLSPPWFLDSDSSMGAFRAEMESKDKEYGEAIIRGIRGVEDWFLRKMGLGEKVRKGRFLTRADESLPVEALALFDFLRNFNTVENCRDIQVGMTHAVYKH